MPVRADDIAPVLDAMPDPPPRRVLVAVASRGEATAKMIAAELPVSRTAVVKHLGVLDHAGLVSGRKAGREVLYTARLAPLADAARWMDAVAAEWDARLARFKRLAELPMADPEARPTPDTGQNPHPGE